MALILNDKSTGKRSETESLDLIAGADDSVLIRATQTLDGIAEDLNIIALVVNDAAVIGNLIANDGNSTDVVAGGLAKGFKNIDGQTLATGAFIQAGKYGESRGWESVTVTSGSVLAYYNYIPSRRA